MSTSLSYNDIILINAALTAFERPEGKLVDGKESRQPYDLGDKAKLAIIRNLKRLKPIIAEIDEERESLRLVYNPSNYQRDRVTGRYPEGFPTETQAAWDTAFLKSMKTKKDGLIFHTAPLSDFNLSKNTTLPMSIVAQLLDIVITDDGAQDGVNAPEPKKE